MACNGKTCRFSPCMFARVPFTHQAPSFFHYSFSFHFTFVVTLAIFFKKPCAHLPFHIATCEVRTYMPGLYVTPSTISADIHIEKLQILNVYIYIIYVLYIYIYVCTCIFFCSNIPFANEDGFACVPDSHWLSYGKKLHILAAFQQSSCDPHTLAGLLRQTE